MPHKNWDAMADFRNVVLGGMIMHTPQRSGCTLNLLPMFLDVRGQEDTCLAAELSEIAHECGSQALGMVVDILIVTRPQDNVQSSDHH